MKREVDPFLELDEESVCCTYCNGAGWEPDHRNEPIKCFVCGGEGWMIRNYVTNATRKPYSHPVDRSMSVGTYPYY